MRQFTREELAIIQTALYCEIELLSRVDNPARRERHRIINSGQINEIKRLRDEIQSDLLNDQPNK